MTIPLAIAATSLTKSYREHQVVRGINLRVTPGSVFALLGPNGAGKTTTVRILATLTRPTSGTALVAGHDIVADPRGVRRSISVTGQYAALDDLQTGAENLRMIGRLAGLTAEQARQRAAELLTQFDLTEAANRRVGTWSGGMRRRLDIAASLVVEPLIVFLDEPTTGLDPRSRLALWNVIAQLASAGITIFLTTQYLEEADRLADRVALIDGGRIVAEGTPAELKRRVGNSRLDLDLVSDDAFMSAIDRLGARATRTDRAALSISVPTDGSAAQVRALLDEIDPGNRLLSQFTVHTATLDDVFLSLTGRVGGQPEMERSNV